MTRLAPAWLLLAAMLNQAKFVRLDLASLLRAAKMLTRLP